MSKSQSAYRNLKGRPLNTNDDRQSRFCFTVRRFVRVHFIQTKDIHTLIHADGGH